MGKMMMDPKYPQGDSEYGDYEVQCAADTLMAAEEIKQDPKMMKLVAPLLDKKIKSIRSLEDLRAEAAKANGSEDNYMGPANKRKGPSVVKSGSPLSPDSGDSESSAEDSADTSED